MKELTIEIYGRVQGVNFRRSLASLAERLKLHGFVKNLDEGGVYCLAQGDEEVLEKLLVWCQRATFPAKIVGMKFDWKDQISKEYNDFRLEFKNNNLIIDEATSLYNLSLNILNNEKINIPNHIVIIPDGNRRWAREKGWKAYIGHRHAMSYERIKTFFDKTKELKIKYFSFWGFSTENWDRETKEIDVIFQVFRSSIKKWKEEFVKEGIKFKHSGRKDRLPKDIIQSMSELEELTKNENKLVFQFCFDYGGRDELVRAYNRMLKDGITSINELTIKNYLDSKNIPDPDLIIRTAGEKRTSGVMAYQSTYAELYFTNVFFPDFTPQDLERAILDYSARTRRFGGTNVKDIKNINQDSLIDPDKTLGDGLNLSY